MSKKNAPKTQTLDTIPLHVVAVGSSAGGLEAINELVANLRKDTPAAYVIAQHLAPNQPSMLTDLIRRSTSLEVVEASDKTPLEAGKIYVTPPGRNIGVTAGAKLQVITTDEKDNRHPHPQVDYLFQSLLPLAKKGRVVSIILSGSGSDGARGMAELFANGGLCIAQDPATAVYPSMPDAAIRADATNHIATPSAIADLIHTHITGAPKRTTPPITESALSKILEIAHKQTGHDFSQYKSATLLRRMHRRMSIHNMDDIEKYLELFSENKDEVDRFVQEAFISVTEFFRDPEHFQALTDMLAERLRQLDPDESFRVWVPGCAGGEEAISIAIAISELRDKYGIQNEFIIFATDVDTTAIGRGRAGYYPDAVVNKIDPDYIDTYFVPMSGGGYEVQPSLRERIVFSRHNVISDPPFSKLNLISCRNMLIYFNQRLQEQVIERFYFGLKTGGALFLGNSESVPTGSNLFVPIDTKYRLFRKIGDRALTNVSYSLNNLSGNFRQVENHRSRPPRSVENTVQTLISNIYGPPTLVLNGNDEVVYASGGAEEILNMSPGAVSLSIVDMLEKPVRAELRALVHKCRREGRSVYGGPQVLTLKGEKTLFRFSVRLFDAERTEWTLVSLEKAPVATPEQNLANAKQNAPENPREWLVTELEQELTATRERLATVVEELEITNEALQTANEELQSANEEYQSTNEELQTTNEEFQSANEELQTVNDELRLKSSESDNVNYALQNILQSVRDPILVVDTELRITRYNRDIDPYVPYAAIRNNDLITALPWRAEIEDFRAKLQAVQTTMKPHREVVMFDEKPVQVRITPYLDHHEKITGALLLFTDISELYVAQAALENEKELAQVTLGAITDGVIRTDSSGTIQYINPAATSALGWPANEAIGQKSRNVFRLLDKKGEPTSDITEECIGSGKPIHNSDPQAITTHGKGQIYVEYAVIPLAAHGNGTSGCVITFRDVSERRRTIEQMEWHSKHDTLTGLLNRRAMDQALTAALRRVKNKQEKCSYIFFDLDQFKLVNDNWGHEAGDQLLKRVAVATSNKLRKDDLAGRLGGDEFGVILKNCSLSEATNIASILRDTLKETVSQWDGNEVSVSSSFGVMEITPAYQNITEIRVDADSACYTAKLRGRDAIQVFDADDDVILKHRKRIKTAATISKDIKQDNFHLFAQPIVPRGDKTGKPKPYAEILLRVENEDGTLGSPVNHIEAANQYGYMLSLDRWVISNTVATLAGLAKTKRPNLAVNVSAASLSSKDFMRWFSEYLQEHKDICRHLCLEFSEQVTLNQLASTRENIDEVVKLGCSLALDDFGAGLSSLKHLTELDLDYVKLDRSLVQNLPDNNNYREIAQSVVSLAKKLNIQTIAEAVETKEQLAVCDDLKIDHIQGYLTGRPMPLNDFLKGK